MYKIDCQYFILLLNQICNLAKLLLLVRITFKNLIGGSGVDNDVSCE